MEGKIAGEQAGGRVTASVECWELKRNKDQMLEFENPLYCQGSVIIPQYKLINPRPQ